MRFNIWVQLGSANSSCEFLATPKVAASAVECQSVTIEEDLDTEEVDGSNPFGHTIFFHLVPCSFLPVISHLCSRFLDEAFR